MLLTQAFQRKKNHSIPSSDEEAKHSRTGLKNFGKLRSRTSEAKKSYLEAEFEMTIMNIAFKTIQMRLVDSLNLSTRGAKTNFV